FYESKPEVGIYDASYGIFLKGDGKGNFTALSAQESGINIRGAVRDLLVINNGEIQLLLAALNNGPLRIIKAE
ncbi:MAG TPA: hypothetical protein VFW07_07035, partial [Parafilimonas sp.]|nr:hypothetical protein [Parafilimonas sp.]